MNPAAYFLEALSADPNLAREFKRIFLTPDDLAEIDAINAKEAEAELEAREREDRDEIMREMAQPDYRGRPL